MNTSNDPPDFPAGKFVPPGEYGAVETMQYAEQLRKAPLEIRAVVEGLSEEQLNTVYRNWSIRQIVHHLADSHMNAYIRFKWALTEESPLIKSYDETKWSELVDARETPIECSMTLLDGLHERWASLVDNLTVAELLMNFFHPERGEIVSIFESLPSYVWHTRHHVAQIAWLRERM